MWKQKAFLFHVFSLSQIANTKGRHSTECMIITKTSKPEDLVANGKGMIYQTPQLLYPGLLWLQNIRTFYFFSLGFKNQKLNFLTQNRAFR